MIDTPLGINPEMAYDVGVHEGVRDRIARLGDRIAELSDRQEELAGMVGIGDATNLTWTDVFNGYASVVVVAFLTTLLATPLMRRLAISNGIVDHPNDARKIHRMPVAYLGGVAVFLGIMAGILVSYVGARMEGVIRFHATEHLTIWGHPHLVPPWIVLGIFVIMLIGLIDDVAGISPRLKVGGQLFAAAALAYGQVGVNVAKGLLSPTLGALLQNSELTYHIPLPEGVPIVGELFGQYIEIDFIYWTGTAVIAAFVLGGCNASNLIDGLDGLCSGVTAIATVGFLAIAMMMVEDPNASGWLDSARIVLCMSVLGACLGFLPHNFNPATIFLGDCGSLLLGFVSVVIILTLGDTGRTDLVVAGLIIYSIPIIDTALAIIRRKLAKQRMSDADKNHLHHMLTRAFGVKGAAFSLYGIGAGFAVLGVLMAASNARIVYTAALLFSSFIAVYATKIARKKQLEEQSLAMRGATASAPAAPVPPTPGSSESDAGAETNRGRDGRPVGV